MAIPEAAARKDGFKLPRPPYQRERKKASELRPYIPLPPCSFQSSWITSSGKSIPGVDPFFAAYIKCTGGAGHEVVAINNRHKREERVSRRAMLSFFCQRKLDVAEGAMVELPSSPLVRSSRKQIHGSKANGIP